MTSEMGTERAANIRANLERTLQEARQWKNADPDALAIRADIYHQFCNLICDLQSAFIAPPVAEREP